MKTTITKKEKAIEILKRMNIYKPYIKGFEEEDKVCFFEQFGGFWIDQEAEVYAKMKFGSVTVQSFGGGIRRVA